MNNYYNEIDNISDTLKSLINRCAENAIHESIRIMDSKINTNLDTNNINTNNINSKNSYIKHMDANKLNIIDEIKINGNDYHNDNKYININKEGIFSNINNNKNVLVMLETLKNLMIESNIITEEKFENEYNNVLKYLEDKMVGEKVANELIKDSIKIN